MSAYTGDIVKDGLTLYLDAANYKSFVSGSTTWYDLARPGFTGSLINGPAYTGSNKGAIIFDGTNDYVSLPSSSLASSSQMTFALWNFGQSITNPRSVIYFENASGIRTLNVHLTYHGTIYFDAGNGSGNTGGAFDRINKGVTASELFGWQYWVFTKNATAGTMRIYRNGELWHSGGGSAPIGASVTGSLGASLSIGWYHVGHIGMAKLYSRELSAAEIRENYNATKGRYDTFRSSDAIKPRLSTSGLVLHLDAANYRSFVSGSTTWRDLSGNGFNGTLTNGPVYSSANNGSIIFDGTNDFVQCTGTIVTSTATFLVWMYRNGNQGQYDGVLFSRGSGTNVTGLGFYSSNQLGYHWNDNSNTYNWNSGLIVPDLQWSLCAVSVGPTSATAYLCQQTGITSAVNNVSHASTTIDDIKIGTDEAAAARSFAGNIAVAQIYNRALSRDEIVQYFNYTKGRYGYVR